MSHDNIISPDRSIPGRSGVPASFELHAGYVAFHRAPAELVFDAVERSARALRGVLRKGLRLLAHRRLQRRRYRELSALSDQTLRDIGLARGDLHYVAETGIDPRPRAANDNTPRRAA